MSEDDRRDREEDARIWRERRLEIQSRVTPKDFAFFLHQLEQIEARLVGQGIGGDDGEDDEFIFAARAILIGYIAYALWAWVIFQDFV